MRPNLPIGSFKQTSNKIIGGQRKRAAAATRQFSILNLQFAFFNIVGS
jgi:hypothetical protein